VWLGICAVVSVVEPALKPDELIERVLLIVGVCEAKAVVNPTEPPVLAFPVTTRRAKLL
jgi:hypothetical protein